jgi:catechol 2,3-dioxygenase-like lactoylglutathione lyase family enzyme
MIDHISLAVSNLERSVAFYERALVPLGLSRLVTRPGMVGFGKTYPEIWINLRTNMQRLSPDNGVHLCLRAKSTGEVDAFYDAAVAAGATSESRPSLRPHDRVRYYATFIVDPDGNRIEAVTFPKDEADPTA